jgi:hypothetical protein
VTDDAGRARGPLVTALVRGALAFAWVALAGQAIAFAVYAVSGLYRPWSWVKIGFLYVLSFCGVAVEATVPAVGSGPLRVRLVLMLGTALVVWVAFRAGAAVVRSARFPGVGAAAAWGAGPAAPFALLAGLGSLLVSLRFPDNGIEHLRPVTWESFALPLIVVAVAGAAGGVAESVRGRPTRVTEAAAGGWRMFVAALLLALAGVLALAAIEPGVTGAYARGLRRMGPGGDVLFAHHLLLLPNQSIDVLAPSMGGSTELVVADGGARLAIGGISRLEGIGLLTGWGPGGLAFPSAYLLFLAVPAIATVMGGRRAAEDAIAGRERAVRATIAGAVFAALVAAGSAMATIVVSGSTGWQGWLGPTMPSTVVLALAWGVVGGIIGALLPRRR